MKISPKVSLAILSASVFLGLVGPIVAHAATSPSLGAASTFSVLANTGITGTVPASGITGNVENNAIAAQITALTTAMVSGTIYSSDAGNTGGTPPAATTIKNALVQTNASTAYDNLDAGDNASPANCIGGVLTDGTELTTLTQPLAPGVYCSAGIFNLTGQLTLLGTTGTWVFKTVTGITVANSASVTGGDPCNVWWRIGSAATIGNSTSLIGTIIASTGIWFGTSFTLNGRALAIGGDVTLNSGGTISGPTCTAAAVVASAGSVQNGTIKVVKIVVNDNGGTKTVADFPLFVNGIANGHQLVISGETNTFFTFGLYPYTVTETSDPNYTATFSGDCDANGFLNLAPGDHKTCTITNNDKGTAALPATITVVKKVINDNGGTRTVASFPLSVNGTQVVSGGTNAFPVGTYTVNEIGDSNYTRTFSGDCNSNGVMNLIAGDHKTCTITNNDNAAVIVPKLPSTGLPSQGRTPWDIFITAGILMVVSSSLVLALKKRTT